MEHFFLLPWETPWLNLNSNICSEQLAAPSVSLSPSQPFEANFKLKIFCCNNYICFKLMAFILNGYLRPSPPSLPPPPRFGCLSISRMFLNDFLFAVFACRLKLKPLTKIVLSFQLKSTLKLIGYKPMIFQP